MDSAVVHFQEALRRDPLYAPAHAGLADVHVLGYGPAGMDGLPLAIAAARAALRLDGELAEADTSMLSLTAPPAPAPPAPPRPARAAP